MYTKLFHRFLVIRYFNIITTVYADFNNNANFCIILTLQNINAVVSPRWHLIQIASFDMQSEAIKISGHATFKACYPNYVVNVAILEIIFLTFLKLKRSI